MGFTRMKNINVMMILNALIALILSSCVEVGQLSESNGGGTRTKSSSGSSTSNNNNNNAGDANQPEFQVSNVSWYNGDEKVDTTLALNESFTSVITLRGQSVHDFLGRNGNIDKQFCLVASYNGTGYQKNLRLRAAPVSFFNIAQGSVERILRIDFNDKTTNTSVCSGSAYQITSNLANASSVGTSDSAFLLNEVCSSCSGIISSTNISLYESNSGLATSYRVDDLELSLVNFSLRIDTASNIIDDVGGSCNQSQCKAKGENYCCLQNQCVIDGEEKPNASSHPDYQQAKADVDDNPNAYLLWKEIFFVCGSVPPPVEPEPTPIPDPQEEAETVLQNKLKQYNCLEEGKKDIPDFGTNQVCEPGFDTASYEQVRSNVWAQCGCRADPFPTDPDDPRCPNFGLKLVRDIGNNITDVVCDTPLPPSPVPVPFQELNLDISTRTAPHRFYRSDNGESVDINLSKQLIYDLPDGVTAEGSEFSYIDQVNKLEPDSGQFNMNAITGQFSLQLDQAIPAQTIDVEFNTNYIISATKGFYTPCPECNKDHWFEAFSAWPSSTFGAGISATRAFSGYSTNRKSYSGNDILANYEDNIFGRACFVPPTMLPFTHKKNTDVITQRQNRLATQAALYVNGYQRDWYGFNKGALIASFDGVRWFAVGKGRRVNSTSKKLYLAINAPFADLAENSSISVQITENFSNTQAADYDYDPNLSPNDPFQNSAGTCQHFHSCSRDADCVTKLGWEYMCGETSQFKSIWPIFDINGNELADDENPGIKFSKILQGGFPTGPKNRCIYRGSGSICKKDFSTLDQNKQRLFTCAPNFYCADLTDNEFNNQLAREPAEEGIFQLGREANVLGRPLNYIGGGNGLTTAIIENIRYNAALFSADVNDFGICRPGKKLSATFADQHTDKDNSMRTDYINQISSCNSEALGDTRVQTCPIFEDEDDQAVANGDYIFTANISKAHSQNMCGQESQYNDGTTDRNTFQFLELGALNSLSSIDKDIEVLAQDACFRRAGSVCHTDLDCSPNRLHASKAESFSRVRFGGTDAEKEFWTEALVCGQSDEAPNIQDEDYFNYDMTKNRCCRGVGNDFTMYTQDDDGIIDDISKVNTGLDVDLFPYNSPTASGRYSRYAAVGASDNATPLGTTPVNQAPIVEDDTVPKSFQWKTIHDTGKKNCCGGGWIRKFADGSTDWSISRFNPDITNFACLNYQSDITLERPDHVLNTNYSLDVSRLCRSPADNGCHQVSFPLPDGQKVTNPTELTDTTATLSTRPLDESNVNFIELSSEVPYNPVPYPNANRINQDFSDDNRYTFFANSSTYNAVSFYLPIYMGYIDSEGNQRNNDSNSGAVNNIIDVRFRYIFSDGGTDSEVGTLTANPTFMPDRGGDNLGPLCDVDINPRVDLNENEWCVELTDDGHYVFHARAADSGGAVISGGDTWTYGFIEIDFKVQNRDDYLYTALATDTDKNGMGPGNALYYLTKLGRFELLGVPQMVYEPLYCNSNREKIVDGLFNTTSATRTDFEDPTFSFTYNNNAINGREPYEIYDATNTPPAADVAHYNGYFAVQDDRVSHEPIFKSSEFRCCVKLNGRTNSTDKCCSGHSIAGADGDRICKLPKGANLNVYFNKFISGEGVDNDLPEGLTPLDDNDFIPETGEIKLNETAYSKLGALGAEFCENGVVRNGGAFGFFFGEPYSTYIQVGNFEGSFRYGILDNTNPSIDNDDLNDTGTAIFNQGFKWDHHLYCE